MTTTNSDIPEWKKEIIRLNQEVKKLNLLVNKINGLKLVKSGDKEFNLIDDALYCAGKYWCYYCDREEDCDILRNLNFVIMGIIINT